MSTELLTVAATLLAAQITGVGILVTIMLQLDKRSIQRTERLGAELKGEIAEMRSETTRRFERAEDQTKSQFERVYERFEQMETETKRQFERVYDRFERMEAETKRQFERVDDHFERVDERFDEMAAETKRQFEQAAAETKRQFEQVDERFDRMAAETKRLFEAMDVRIRGLENGQARLAAELSMLKDIFTHQRPRE